MTSFFEKVYRYRCRYPLFIAQRYY